MSLICRKTRIRNQRAFAAIARMPFLIDENLRHRKRQTLNTTNPGLCPIPKESRARPVIANTSSNSTPCPLLHLQQIEQNERRRQKEIDYPAHSLSSTSQGELQNRIAQPYRTTDAPSLARSQRRLTGLYPQAGNEFVKRIHRQNQDDMSRA